MTTLNNCLVPNPTKEDLNRRLSLEQLFKFQDELNTIVQIGWTGVVSRDQYETAMLDELTEILGHGVNWKWWKFTDPDTYDEFAVKVEVVDAVHFYLSIMIQDYLARMSKSDGFYMSDKVYQSFSIYYIGSDKSSVTTDVGIIQNPNVLKHDNYRSLVDGLLDSGRDHDTFDQIFWLSVLVGSMGMTSEEFSAIYTAKHELNIFRQTEGYQDGTYVKVEDGVEDNDRLKPLVQAFLDNKTMILTTLRTNVQNAFFELSTP